MAPPPHSATTAPAPLMPPRPARAAANAAADSGDDDDNDWDEEYEDGSHSDDDENEDYEDAYGGSGGGRSPKRSRTIGGDGRRCYFFSRDGVFENWTCNENDACKLGPCGKRTCCRLCAQRFQRCKRAIKNKMRGWEKAQAAIDDAIARGPLKV